MKPVWNEYHVDLEIISLRQTFCAWEEDEEEEEEEKEEEMK